MTLEMRELRGDDLFTVISIIGKLDIEEEIKELIELNIEDNAEKKIIQLDDHKEKKPTKKEAKQLEIEKINSEKETALRTSQFVAELLTKLIRNANSLKGEINPFLADLTGKSEKEIRELPITEYINLLKSFFQKEDLKGFFSSIASLA